MIVTQIAILSLKEEPVDGAVPSGLLAAMRSAREHVQGFTGNAFYHFQEFEDPKKIYVLGEWESISFHMDVFLKRPENIEKVKSFVNWVDVKGIKTLHLDLRMKDIDVEAPVHSIARYPIAKAKRPDFEKVFNERLRPSFQSSLTEGDLAYGWKQEPSEEVDDLFIIEPWRDAAQYSEAAKAHETELQGYMQGHHDIQLVKRLYF